MYVSHTFVTLLR